MYLLLLFCWLCRIFVCFLFSSLIIILVWLIVTYDLVGAFFFSSVQIIPLHNLFRASVMLIHSFSLFFSWKISLFLFLWQVDLLDIAVLLVLPLEPEIHQSRPSYLLKFALTNLLLFDRPAFVWLGVSQLLLSVYFLVFYIFSVSLMTERGLFLFWSWLFCVLNTSSA